MPMTDSSLLFYQLGNQVEAFSTRCKSTLPYPVLQPKQIHSDKIYVVKRLTQETPIGYDALVTALPNFAIGVRTADCIPVLLYDCRNRVIAAVHCGWRGTVLKLSEKVIRLMMLEYGSHPECIKAVIGPGIGPDSFQVKEDVVSAFDNAGFSMDEILINKGTLLMPDYFIDLWKANSLILEKIGIISSNIFTAGICSFINHDEFYSARYLTNNKCPRTISSIMLIKR